MKILRSERRAFEDSAESVQSASAALEEALGTLRTTSGVINEDAMVTLATVRSQAVRASRSVAQAAGNAGNAFQEIERTAGIVRAAAVALVLIAAAVAITKIKAANR